MTGTTSIRINNTKNVVKLVPLLESSGEEFGLLFNSTTVTIGINNIKNVAKIVSLLQSSGEEFSLAINSNKRKIGEEDSSNKSQRSEGAQAMIDTTPAEVLEVLGPAAPVAPTPVVPVTPVASTPAPVLPVAPVGPVDVVPFTEDCFVTGDVLTKSQHAYNLLGSIVHTTTQGGAVSRTYNNNPRIVSQISAYVKDPKNGVVHDAEERSVTITRAPLTALLKGAGVSDINDRITTHFGNKPGKDGKVDDSALRKNFSGLVSEWEKKNAKDGKEYLNTFEYLGKNTTCAFKFLY